MRRIPGFHDSRLTAISWTDLQIEMKFSTEVGGEEALIVKGEKLAMWFAGEAFPSVISGIELSSPENSQIAK